jgi:hypothetical protein
VLREGRPAHVLYDTRFFVHWPAHLGGGSTTIDVSGSMVLVPLISY